jgi:hypothetical protein
MGVIARAIRFYRANGAFAMLRKTLTYLHRKLIRPFVPYPVGKRRLKLGRALYRKSGGTVLAGPLQGFRLNRSAKWGASDFGPMLLGTYEAPILATLIELSKSADLLIDIGAADGYFGVGLVSKGYFERSACFEMDAGMRRALTDVARLNGVEHKVLTFGVATDELTAQLAAAGVSLSDAVVLCDIEGAEFDLFTPEVLAGLDSCPIIIELHEAYFEDGKERLAALIKDAEKHFEVSFIDHGPRELSEHEFVRHLIEDDRWLLTSEGRCVNQRWLLLRPRR